MKRILALTIIFAATLLYAADKQTDELNQFRTFIAQHPRALDELKKDPSLLSKPEYAQQHKVVGEYLAQHPTIKDQVKKIPHFFDNLTATTKGGEHHPHPDGSQPDKPQPDKPQPDKPQPDKNDK